MKYLAHITLITLTIIVISCKNEKPLEPEEKKPIVIKEIKFPEQNKTTTPPPNKPEDLVDVNNLKNALTSQENRRENNVRAFRQQLRQTCLRGLRDRPVLKFTILANGKIDSFSFVRSDDQNIPMELDESIIKCTAGIVKNANLGVVDIQLPNKPKMNAINMTIPM